MKKQYKIQLPKGKKVTMTNVDFEDGVMTVNVEIENRENFHEAIHNEVCGVFGKINNQWKEVLKANGITREKIEEMAKESIKELEKDCPDICDKMIQEYGEDICGKTEQKYDPKDGDFVKIEQEGALYFTPDLGIGYSEKEPSIGIFKSIEMNEGKELLFCYITLMRDSQYEVLLPLEHEGHTFSVGAVSNLKVSPATEAEKKLLIDKLAKINKKWNKWTKSIEDIEYIPQDGDIVTMPMVSDLANFLKAKKYIAIYKREDIEEKKIYCYFIIGQHRNGDTFVFEEDHITDNGTMISGIKPATKEEKYLLFDKLAESGKRWNEEKKCLEDVRWRAKKGEPYSYLLLGDTDILVTTTTDKRVYKDDERFNSGNYFKTEEAAEKVAEQIRDIFKNSKSE